MKLCCKCKSTKPRSDFYVNHRVKDGLNSFCITCHKADNIARKAKNRANPLFRAQENAYKKQYRLQTTAQRKEYMEKWRVKNPTAGARYYENNLDAIKQYAQEYRQKNKHRINAKTRKRQIAKLHRTPKWLDSEDLWLIEEIYHLSMVRTKSTGFTWHVDHIIPLQGGTVSGLHVPNNLQVIPAKMNYKKHNKFEVNNGTF